MKKKILRCKQCSSKSQDLNVNPKAWDGWQVVPPYVCPQCIAESLAAKGFKIVSSQVRGKRIETLMLVGSDA